MASNAQPRRMNDEPLDLLIIGTGIYGVQALRTYLSIHPTHKVLALEAGESPGGVWSKERVYPHFFTQSPLEIWEFSDKALSLPEGEEAFYDHFPAKHFAKYLEEYMNDHVFEGKSLRERVVCSSGVKRLWKEGEVWKATTTSGGKYVARKVMDATGLTSFPNIPQIKGAEAFEGLQIHSKDFGRQSSTVLEPKTRVVVVGGGKSAGDVVYACVKSGLKDVNWVIRKSGNGPAAYLPADAPVRKYRNSNTAFHTSFMSTVTGCIYSPQSWWTWFLYLTSVGRAFLSLLWMVVQSDVYGRAKYNRKDATAKENGFANLTPDGPLFWQISSSGINQRPDFYDIIASKAKVYRQDIDQLSATEMALHDGTAIKADVIVYATGWHETTPYIGAQTSASLGLATTISALPVSTSGKDDDMDRWSLLEKEADAQVLQRFPNLAKQPLYYKKAAATTPFRLYRSMFPTASSTPTIAFLGRTNFANHTYNAEVQALYATAVFDGHVKLPNPGQMRDQVALVNAWMKRRYPAKGQRGSFFFFDAVPYTDQLLEDLGFGRVARARGVFGSMGAKWLRGVLDEYLARTQGEGKKHV